MPGCANRGCSSSGRRISKQRVQDAVANAAASGIGRVTPHQLRHTLATQAINRGMSLEAILALLGHKSMRMTMVHAKIANRIVADEYFTSPRRSRRSTTNPESSPRPRKAPRCESSAPRCTDGCSATATAPVPSGLTATSNRSANPAPIQTTIEFRPTLQRQRDDAANNGQVGRQKIFDGLLQRLDAQAS